jgi:hypothetical protein
MCLWKSCSKMASKAKLLLDMSLPYVNLFFQAVLWSRKRKEAASFHHQDNESEPEPPHFVFLKPDQFISARIRSRIKMMLLCNTAFKYLLRQILILTSFQKCNQFLF